MYQAIGSSLVSAALILMQPTASRPTLDTIIVNGADYAGVQPEPEGMFIAEGVPLSFGFAWVPPSVDRIVFRVDPHLNYTLHAFTLDDSGWPDVDPVREETVIELPVMVQAELNYAFYQLFRYQQIVNDMTAEPDVDYFMVSEAVAHARTRLLNEP